MDVIISMLIVLDLETCICVCVSHASEHTAFKKYMTWRPGNIHVHSCIGIYHMHYFFPCLQSRVPVYIHHTPAGTSVRNMFHFAQMYDNQDTTMFDYGNEADNMKHYNSTKPPGYSISPVNTTVSLFYSQNDWLADIEVGI